MINEDKLEEIKKLVQDEVKNIDYQGNMTIIEFENGQILPLYGGIAGIENTKQKLRLCSFCNNESVKDKPLISLTKNDEPLICVDCIKLAIQTCLENGIDIELDLTNVMSQELIEGLMKEEPNQ